MKVLTVLGARPQFVKAAVVSRALSAETEVEEILVHTGQHYDKNMSDLFFEEMSIPQPQFHLGVGSGSHAKMTGAIMSKLEDVCLETRPDAIMVYGDTNSTLAAALCGSKMGIPIVHVEAGLRSHNMRMPEEINRILTDRISKILFCPTQTAVDNLMKEGFEHFGVEIAMVGDVMLDAAMYYAPEAARNSSIRKTMGLDKYALCTIHRAENTDDPSRLREIFSALKHICRDQTVVLPMHPRTRRVMADQGFDVPGLSVIEPVGYFDMLELIQGSSMILTDSGGLQKEAYFFTKPCITMRDETEWIETVESGANKVTGASNDGIVKAYEEFSSSPVNFDLSLFGSGKAASVIAERLEQAF